MQEYKKIFKSQAIRFKILKHLAWVPDGIMLRLQYAVKYRRRLELTHPKRFTEQVQWYKINHRDPIMTTCADKIAVRDFVRERGYAHLLTELYATADSVATLELDQLPEKFVLKTNNGSGTNIIVSDRSRLRADSFDEFDEWLERDYFAATREWPYKDVPPRILAEEFLEDPDNCFDGINDYKIYCFHGVPKFVLLAVDRANGPKMNIYTTEWEDTGVGRTDTPNIPGAVPRPENLDSMTEIAEGLSEGFPFVRVDLYSVSGQIYFGELTFFPASGYVEFSPDSFDFELGELWPFRAR